MKLLWLVVFLYSAGLLAQAQNSGQSMNPNEIAEMKKRMEEMDAQRAKEAAAKGNEYKPLAPIPPPGGAGGTLPNQPGMPGQQNPQPNPGQQNPGQQPNTQPPNNLPLQGATNPPPPNMGQPLLAPLPPKLSGGVIPINTKVLEQTVANRVKSPFMIPNELYLKLMRKKGDSPTEGLVDLSVEPSRRWALKYYSLVAVIWNVKNPKAMILDKEGKMHLYREKDYIANQEGVITEINNGEVVVLERGVEVKLKLKK